MDILRELSEALEKGDAKTVAALTSRAIEQKLEPRKILDE